MAKQHDEPEWDRRGFLKCMAWVGTGAVWTMTGGVLKGLSLEQAARGGGMAHAASANGLRFAQISDSHIGFNKDANKDVTATLREAVSKIKAAPEPPSFVLHTGDLTHLSKPEEFDTLQQVLTDLSVPVFYVPGEHDVLNDDGKSYLARFGKNTKISNVWIEHVNVGAWVGRDYSDTPAYWNPGDGLEFSGALSLRH